MQTRLDKAKELGADNVILGSKTETPEELAQRIESTIGRQSDQTLECTGAAPCISSGIFVSSERNVVYH